MWVLLVPWVLGVTKGISERSGLSLRGAFLVQERKV